MWFAALLCFITTVGLGQGSLISASINESCPVEVEIARVTGPAGGQGEVNYALSQILQQRGVDEHFRVDSKTGAILLKTPLDYEEDKQYTYVVDKVDPQSSKTVGKVLVRIDVTDVNDNPPVFTSPTYGATVRDRIPPYSPVLQVLATDKDSGKNAELSYKIDSGADGYFGIDEKGRIVSIQNLGSQNLRLFTMSVSATDHGEPPLTTEHPAQVSILVSQQFKVGLRFRSPSSTTVKLEFSMNKLHRENVAKYGIIVQRSNRGDADVVANEQHEALTWHNVKEDGQETRRYIAMIIPSDNQIEKSGKLSVEVGTEDCTGKDKDEYCNGPLTPGHRYRFQLRAYLKNSGPFTDTKFTDSKFARCLIAMPSKSGRKN